MTYEYACGGVWQGLLADGILDMDTVNQKIVKHYGHGIEDRHSAIVDTINHIRKQYRGKVSTDKHDTATDHIEFCRATCDFIEPKTICETYALTIDRPNSNKLADSPYMPAIYRELEQPENDRITILTLSNCQDILACTKTVLAELDFAEHPQHKYNNYKSFSEAAEHLIEDAIEYFESPCCKLFEHLQKQGFRGDLDTYA